MGVPKPIVVASDLTTTHVVSSLLSGVIMDHMTVSFTGLQALWRGNFSYSTLVLQLIGIFVYFSIASIHIRNLSFFILDCFAIEKKSKKCR